MIRVGPYELLAEVGRGAFGAVYRARAGDGAIVAVKLIRSTVEAEKVARELRLLENLGPAQGFVGLLDSGTTPQGCYLVMPFLGGGTLRDRLKKGPLSVADTLSLGEELARALSAAHAQGIVHRDLKPENVLYSEEGRLFVGDLGLAKHFRRDVAGASMSLSFSVGGDLKGTIGYAPPEQLRGAKDVGPQADVFALGAILFECLAGAPAFSGETMLAVLEKVVRGAREPLAKLRPDAPRALQAVIERCLAHDEARRYADGAALHAALTESAAPRRRVPAVALAVGVALVVAVVALVIALAVAAGVGPSGTGPGPEVPPPPPPPPSSVKTPPPLPAEGTFPPLCSGFLRGKSHLRLLQVIGDFDWKVAGEVHSLAYSPDGALLLSGQGHHERGETQWKDMLDKTVVLWDAASGHELRRFVGHTSGVTGCAFLAGGKRAVSASYDGSIRLWDVATGECTSALDPGVPILAAALGRDGATFAVGLLDGSVLLYDLAKGDAPLTLGRHDGGCFAVGLSTDGSRVVSGGQDGIVRILDVASARVGSGRAAERARFAPKTPVRAVAFAADERQVYYGDDAGLVHLGDYYNDVSTASRDQEVSPVLALVLARGKLYTAHRSGSIRARDPGSLDVRELVDDRTLPVQALAATRDGSRIAWGGRDELIATLGSRATPDLVHKASRVAVNRKDGVERIATAGTEGSLRLWDGATGKELWTAPSRRTQTYGLAISHNGKRIATASEGGSVRLWNVESGAIEMAFEKHPGAALRAVFSSDDALTISCGDAGRMFIWDVIGDPRELVGHTQRVFAVAYCGDGKRVVSCSQDRSIRVWDVAKAVELRRIANAHHDLVGNVATAPSGDLALSASWDGTVKLWNLATGQLVRELPKQPRVCFGLGFLDERRAVISGYDGTVGVWDVTTGTLLDSVSLSSATDWSGNIAPTGDGKTFLAGTGRGVVLRFAFEE